tara:strand:+ start:13 stop:882 length:870 start_codon:yes stop_codon:yes gene_type:complete
LARNSKRSKLGAGLEDSTPAAADSVAAALETGGLNFTTPTEFVDLPSQGRYYPENHPLHGQETVEIKYMTAKEEDILSSKTLIKQGVAIERLIKSVLVDKNINPETLYSGDRNAILVATRITGYGAEYETKVTCPSCMNTGDHSFDLNEVSVRTMDDVESDDSYEVNEEGSIVAVTPMTKITVEMKLMTGKDESYLSRLTESKRKKKLPETTLTDTLKILITSLNGETSPDLIKKFIKVMPARDSRFLRSVYEKASPNIDMTQDFECSTCGYVTDLEVPFTPDFFWPKQ